MTYSLRLRPMCEFLLIAFGWAWGFGYAAGQLKATMPALSVALSILAGFGPSLAAVIVVHQSDGLAGLRRWLRRCLNWQVGWQWFALAFLAPPTAMLAALGLHVLLGGELPVFTALAHVPLAIANFGLVLLVGGPLGEEFGWRGYLTTALVNRLSWRTTSLLVGMIWGIWHVPLFFQGNTVQSHMALPVFLLNILAGSVLFGWISEKTRGSVLPALVLHTSLNGWVGILGIVPTAETSRPYNLVTLILVIVATTLILAPNPKAAVALAPGTGSYS